MQNTIAADTVIAQLEIVLGKEALIYGPAVSERASSWLDSSPLQAAAIVRPCTTEDVATVLRICDGAGQAVVTRGGGTNLVDATRTEPHEIVLSMERMTAVETIEKEGHALVVQAGAPLEKVQAAAEVADLLFPLDLAARASATVGGLIAMNAGGTRVLRYGSMRELVLGVEAVLADGTILTCMNRMLKNNAGYDLKQLLIGSEGSLGVVTRAVLRLYPTPRSVETALLATETFEQVAALLALCRRDLAGTLASFEVMRQDYYRLTTSPPAPSSPPLGHDHAYYVLIEILGGDPLNDRQQFERALDHAYHNGLVDDAVVAMNGHQRQNLWRVREDSEQIERQHHLTFGYDVSLPIGEMEEYVEDVRSGFEFNFGPESRSWVYGHLGDGNLHLSVWHPALNEGNRVRADTIVYRPLKALGGSISAEHGIGLEKKPYLAWSRSEAEIATMRRLKRALDPHGILNPGKVFNL